MNARARPHSKALVAAAVASSLSALSARPIAADPSPLFNLLGKRPSQGAPSSCPKGLQRRRCMGPTDGAYGPAEDALRVGALPPGILVDGDALFVAQVIRDLQRWSRPTTATACSTAW